MSTFPDVKKNFGFGCMRLPMDGEKVDYAEFTKMVDEFMAQGFNYFDTARVYIGGQSETAIRDCVVKRYPRDSFILTDKLSDSLFNSEDEIRPLFEKQLESCGVDYFDFYLLHSQTKSIFEKYKKLHAYEHAFELKKEGKVKHVGFSFHDTADVLDEMLNEYPEIDVVQIQLNYIDFDDPAVQARLCYEVCRKHNKPVIVMEPVKGGKLADIPEQGKAIFDALRGGSPASYAIRYAADFDGVFMVLSGMSSLEQMNDNLSFMKDFKPLSHEERRAIAEVCDVIRATHTIPCTACRYCTDGCPEHILIPDLFSCMNAKQLCRDWNSDCYYEVYTENHGKASDCIGCGKCEHSCPQHLPIRELLREVAKTFESEEAE